jgi:hypothetical protein
MINYYGTSDKIKGQILLCGLKNGTFSPLPKKSRGGEHVKRKA